VTELNFAPPAVDSLEYRRFVRERGLNHQPERSPVWPILNRLDELERAVERSEESKRNAPSNLDVRRADQRIERLESEQARLYEELDSFPPEHVAAITEARLNTNNRRLT
jgi:predicted nuclease with TOPRIM domain